MAAPEPGTTLAGKYVIERVLGVGGMGVVVAARHIDLDQKVAIKYLLPETLANPEIVERFAREARAAAKIRGEHVARVLDVGRFDDGAPFMVLEYLEGEDLAHLIERGVPIPIPDAIGYVLEACEALAEAHAAGIVHRDLKPANLFLAKRPDRRSIVKVLDFGISKVIDPSVHALTNTSAVMGTPHYMSPEQLIATKRVDARSDIWALGVILYELLSSRKPFEGESLAEIVGAILNNQPERLSSLRSEVSLDLELAIARCLRDKADERHASVKELAIALAPFASAAHQESVEKIARVLGASLKPPPSDPALLAAISIEAPPSSALDRTVSVSSSEPALPVRATVVTAGSLASAEGAHAPSTSAAVTRTVEPTSGRRWLPVLVGVVVIGSALSVGLVATRRTPVIAEPSRSPASSSVAAPALSTSAPVVTVAETTPVAPPASIETAPPAPVASASAVRMSGTTAAGARSSSAVGRTTGAPVAPTAHAPSAAPAPSKNPLQMGLK